MGKNVALSAVFSPDCSGTQCPPLADGAKAELRKAGLKVEFAPNFLLEYSI
mgnify:CR=1 FL=1